MNFKGDEVEFDSSQMNELTTRGVFYVRKTVGLDYRCADVGLEVLKQLGHGILPNYDQLLFVLKR